MRSSGRARRSVEPVSYLNRAGPPPAFAIMRAVANPGAAALLLFLLLVSGPLVALVPGDVGAIRLGGVSLLWWYEGVVVPGAAVIVALVWLPDRAVAPPAE